MERDDERERSDAHHSGTDAAAVTQTFDELFSSEYRGLCRLVYVIIGDAAQAEDIASEAFVRVFARRYAIRDPASLSAYVRRAAVNLARSAVHRRSVERLAVTRASNRPPTPAPMPDDGVSAAEVWEAVLALAPRQRAAVVLRYYADLPDDEIAATLRCSSGTVRSQLFKARGSLAASLGYLQEDNEDA